MRCDQITAGEGVLAEYSNPAWPPDRVIVDVTSDMGDANKAALRGVLQLFTLPVTGVLDKPTAEALDRLRPAALRGD